MKNMINIGGALLFVMYLMKKKKTVVVPSGDLDHSYTDITTPPIIPPKNEDIPVSAKTNNSISPDLTDYTISENQQLINALNRVNL